MLITGEGGLRKIGSGTLTLAGNVLHTGTTAVNSGTLRLTGSLAASNVVIVNTQAAFSARFEDQVAAAGSYAGIATSSNTSNATEARLLAGNNATGGSEFVSMQWRTPGAEPMPLGGQFGSDVLELSGMTGGFAESTRTDPFVLRMKYNPALFSGDESIRAANGQIYLAWLDPSSSFWTNAVEGNFAGDYGPNGFFVLGDWMDYGLTGLDDDLGRWGINSANDTVWAVLDHNSQFSVNAVPEPAPTPCWAWPAASALRSAGCGGLGGLPVTGPDVVRDFVLGDDQQIGPARPQDSILVGPRSGLGPAIHASVNWADRDAR